MSRPFVTFRDVPPNETLNNTCCIIAENVAVILNQINRVVCWDTTLTTEQRDLFTRAANALEIAQYRMNGNSEAIPGAAPSLNI